jgi:hypothetical protein
VLCIGVRFHGAVSALAAGDLCAVWKPAHPAYRRAASPRDRTRRDRAWCLETQAWQVLTAGDYRRAADISQAAQRIVPKSSSAFIQATAQEGRARARLGDARQTRATLSRVEELVSPLPVPDLPEHHLLVRPAQSVVLCRHHAVPAR